MRRVSLTVLALLIVLIAGHVDAAAADPIANAKLDCVYSNERVSVLDQFEQLVDRPISCVMVYNMTSQTWSEWEHPWFVDYTAKPNVDWSAWVTQTGVSGRRLVITQDLFPSSLDHSDWLEQGASGAFTRHARALATDLVSAGLGDSVIRLGHEANGTWYADSLGDTPREWHLWDEFWDKTVSAMRSVPGAHFEFDWCIAAMDRALPLTRIYPGNDAVNIIGIDVYDRGDLGSTGEQRWNTIDDAPDGVKAVVAFARAHGKPISIPEWGVDTVSGGGFGDDPAFVDGIAQVVKDNRTAYQSYFYKYGEATQLSPDSLSLAAYRSQFDDLGVTPAERRSWHVSRPVQR